MSKQTDKQLLDELIVKLYNRGVAPWIIAHTATQDGLYLSANLLTDYDTSVMLHKLSQLHSYTAQSIAQLLDVHYPKMEFPDEIVDIITNLIVERRLDPSMIINNLGKSSLIGSSWCILHGYVLAHADQNHILNELFSLTCKIQRDTQNTQYGQAMEALFEQLRIVHDNDSKTNIDLYNRFEELVKYRGDIHEMVASALGLYVFDQDTKTAVVSESRHGCSQPVCNHVN